MLISGVCLRSIVGRQLDCLVRQESVPDVVSEQLVGSDIFYDLSSPENPRSNWERFDCYEIRMDCKR